jgi:acyl dehydratase
MIDIQVGDELPKFVRTTDFDNWNRYAAVNHEFVGIHMDDGEARASGLPGAIGMGNLQWSYLHNVVRQWLGDRGRILQMSCQFRSANRRGQTVTATGRVTGITPTVAGTEVTLAVWTVDEQGNELAPGTSTVLFDLDSDVDQPLPTGNLA